MSGDRDVLAEAWDVFRDRVARAIEDADRAELITQEVMFIAKHGIGAYLRFVADLHDAAQPLELDRRLDEILGRPDGA